MIRENTEFKIISHPDFNLFFRKSDGYTMTWGKTKDDDPDFSPLGPIIADIEITTKCNGVCNDEGKRILCSECYKSNTSEGDNMSLETYKNIIHKINQNNQLTQVALGLDSQAITNPDIWKICEYTREIGVIPNGTVADISDEVANNISKYFGACAVSNHFKNGCYDSVKKLTDRGMKQVNIHQIIYKENIDIAHQLIEDISTDDRLFKLNAVVFLSLKKAGRGKTGKSPLTQEEFNKLVQHAIDKKINFGMDSCSASKFLKFINLNQQYKNLEIYIEPCESTLFSLYCDVNGIFHPCSFCEHKEGLVSIDLKEVNDFMTEVWMNEKVQIFQKKLLNNNRECPEFDV